MRKYHSMMLFVLLAPMVAPLAANEWDATWAGDVVSDLTTPANYASAAPINSATSWVSDGRYGLTRFDSSGAVPTRVAGRAEVGSQRILRNLPDGGAVFVSNSYVVRIDALGRPLWSFSLYSVFQSLPSDSSVLAKLIRTDDTGAVWLIDRAGQRLHKLAPDGHRMFTLAPGDMALTRMEDVGISPDGQLALVVGTRGEGEAGMIATSRLSHGGGLLSNWSGPLAHSVEGSMYAAAVISADHAVALAFDSVQNLVYIHHDAQGHAVVSSNPAFHAWSREIYFVRATSSGVVIGTSLFIPISTFRQTIQLFTATGESVYGYEFEDFGSIDDLMEASDGALWTAAANIGGVTAPLTGNVTRVSATGISQFPLPPIAATPVLIGLTPDGSGALLGRGPNHYLINASGATLLSPPAAGSFAMMRAMGTTDSDGNSYVVQRRPDNGTSSEGATLSKIARSGQVLWSVPVSQHLRFDGDIWQRFNTAIISANAARVCYYNPDTNFLYCHAAGNGAFQARVELPAPGAFDLIELTTDNQVLLRRHLSGAVPELALDASNLPISANAPAFFARRLSNARGEYLDFGDGTTPILTAISRHSVAAPGATTPLTWQLGIGNVPAVLADGQPAITLLEDGSAVLLGFEANDHGAMVLRKFNADGSLGFTAPIMADARQVGLRVVGGRILVNAFMMPVFNSFFGGHDLYAYSLQDGHLQWHAQASTPSAQNAAFELDVTPDGTHALWWTSDTLDFNARRIRLADGVEVARSDFPCGAYYCSLERVRTDAHGTTLLPSVNRSERDPFAAYVRADQEALEGAWYQPSTSGQGVLFDYLPENRTWFGTWHTSDLSGTNSRAGLRWFTLQGQADAEGTQADLGIYLASGGKFDSGPRISSSRIGDAALKFDSCSSANLEYRITAGELAGHSGSIPLRLLTPQSASCAAIGQTPASVTASTRNGISSSFSGTWYRPDSSGQGLEVAVRPELGNGSIVAGWFTFDPEGNADDALAQHWFTLQGDLSAASNGTVTLPIFRTIGGVFDRTGTRNTSRVGEATWNFLDCAHSQLSYRFDDSDVAGVYAGRIGTIPLQRIGACAAP